MKHALFSIFILSIILFAQKTEKPDSVVKSNEFIEMVFVEGGTFDMGRANIYRNESSIQSVTVCDFYIGKYEITQIQWDAVMTKNPSLYVRPKNPVERVKWDDAIEYCNKLSEMEGYKKCYSLKGDSVRFDFNANGYRLPLEEEWKFAAMGGKNSKKFKFSGSNDINKVAWYSENCRNKFLPGSSVDIIRPDYYTHNMSNGVSHPIGELQPNELGLYDMSGNVYEWCWNYDYFQNELAKSRLEKAISLKKLSASDIYVTNHKFYTFHITCGGGHKSQKIECETNYFMYKSEYDYSSDLGFRVVRNAE